MNAQAENTNQDIFDVEEITSEGSNPEVEENSDAALNRESSEIALKLVNAVKSMNIGEMTHYELVNSFNSSNELKIFLLGWESGNKIFSNEQIDIKAEVLSLSLKYKGAIGLISSVLKYPILFSLFKV